MKLQVIGVGQLGEAIIGGLLKSGWTDVTDLVVVEVDRDRTNYLRARFQGLDVRATPVHVDDVLLSVRPQDTLETCSDLRSVGCKRLLSVVGGWSTNSLESVLGPDCHVVRSIPNVPSLIGAGISGVAGSKVCTESDVAWAVSILNALGTTVVIPENLMDAAAGLAACGPAYIFLVAEAMIEAGVLVGFTRQQSAEFSRQAILGAARMLVETERPPEILRASVTSPGGATAAGLRELERHSVRAAFLDAVSAAARRAAVLGEPGPLPTQ